MMAVNENTLFEPLFAELRADNAAKTTIDTYRLTVREIANIVSELPDKWTDATITQIHNIWLDKMGGGQLSPATVNRKTACLRRLIRAWGCDVKKPKMARVPKRDIFVPTDEQFANLKLTARTAFASNPQIVLAIGLMGYAGLRINEATTLKRENVYVDQEVPSIVVYGKGGKKREAPMVGELVTIWRNAIAVLPDSKWALGRIVKGEDKHPSRKTVWDWVKSVVAEAQLPSDITPHSLRHYAFATFARNGADEHDIQRIAGHSNITMTEHYLQSVTGHDSAKNVLECMSNNGKSPNANIDAMALLHTIVAQLAQMFLERRAILMQVGQIDGGMLLLQDLSNIAQKIESITTSTEKIHNGS